MDQDNTKGQDKRSWRERLGVGAQGNKDLPKISDDFKKEPQPAPRPVVAARPAPRPVAAAPAVRPAPMAPRATPVAPRVAPKVAPPSPVPSDKLAERLRSQREASTRLAEQRVQVAKQRAENQPSAPAPASSLPPGNAPRPKFAFAEDGEAPKPAVPGLAPRPQLAPPRTPLGGTTMPPVAPPPVRPIPSYAPPPQSYAPPQQPAAYQPGYNSPPVPPYRPIDPSTGQPATSGYVPPRGYGVPPQQGGFASGPRLNVPPRVPVAAPPSYGQQPEFAPAGRMTPRQEPRGASAPPQQSEYDEEFYDEMPTARGGRPSSTDYKQAYREAEYGYEEEQPRSKAPWILASFLLFAMLLAGGLTLAYIYYGKPLMGGQLSGQSGTQDVPAVAAPETPAKVAPEQPAAAQQPAVASPTKKQIYDRIVGDQEILGGEVTPPVEAPAAIPEPTNAGDGTTQPAPSGTGEDAAPLPIPPPPGGAGDQQGSLAPDNGKQSSEVITAAAGESQAAVAAQDLPAPPLPGGTADAEAPVPPAPGETDKARSILAESKLADPVATEPETEKIVDAAPLPPVKKKLNPPAKKTAAKVVEKNLGSKPVVLVPPSKKAKAIASKQVASAPAVEGTGGGLYGDEDITVAPAKPAVEPIAAPKKKKTLADLFNNSGDADAAEVAAPAQAEQQVATLEPPAPAKKPAATAPPLAAASGGGGFTVQLASFRSRDEAASEFVRLKSKHGGVLGPYSSIISEAEVGGSTRYRLSAGRMSSQAQANAVCTSLFAKGERDCIVKKQ